MKKPQHQWIYGRMIEHLKRARLSSGLTQGDVSKNLGIYATFVSKIESRERKLDPIELCELLNLYGVNVGRFFNTLWAEIESESTPVQYRRPAKQRLKRSHSSNK